MAAGYTLTELLAVIAITAVLASLVSPSFHHQVQQTRADAGLNDLIAAVNFTRHLAVTMRTTATLCPGQGQCAKRNTWHRGAIVFLDANANGQIDDDEDVVRQFPSIDHGRIHWRSFRNKSYLQFNDRGYTNWQSGHFQYCPLNGDARYSRQVVLNAQGRARSARDSDGDGIREDARGRALVCKRTN